MFPPRNIPPPIVPAREKGYRQRQRPDPPPQEATTATTETTSETVETTLTVSSTEVSSSDKTTVTTAATTTTTATSVTTVSTVEDVVNLEDSETDYDDEFQPGKIPAIEDVDTDDYEDWIPELKNETKHNRMLLFLNYLIQCVCVLKLPTYISVKLYSLML